MSEGSISLCHSVSIIFAFDRGALAIGRVHQLCVGVEQVGDLRGISHRSGP